MPLNPRRSVRTFTAPLPRCSLGHSQNPYQQRLAPRTSAACGLPLHFPPSVDAEMRLKPSSGTIQAFLLPNHGLLWLIWPENEHPLGTVTNSSTNREMCGKRLSSGASCFCTLRDCRNASWLSNNPIDPFRRAHFFSNE